MKRMMAILLAIAMVVTSLTGCGSTDKQSEDTNGKMQIVATTFPIYDWTKNVLGDNPAEAELIMLLDSGVDLHSYQPTAEDILKISTCDVFIYNGGESDEWVTDALKGSQNENMVVINLLESLGDAAKEEEIVDGMQDEDHDHEDDAEESEEDHDHEEEVELDEHIWLSIKNAELLTGVIEKALETADPDNAETYQSNAETYINKLAALDEEYQTALDEAPIKTLLFGDRFPFRYLTEDYGLEYYAAFVGCSAETEASFETITFLSQKVDELSLKSVLTIEGGNQKIAETIVNNTASKNQQIISIDSMQSATTKDIEDGKTYLSIMESNLEVLKEALK